MIDNDLRTKLADISVLTAEQAAYSYHPNYDAIPSSQSDFDQRSWGSVTQAYDQMQTQNMLHIMIQKLAETGMESSYTDGLQNIIQNETDFTSFSLLAHGTGTVALLAKSDSDIAVLRVSAHPESPLGSESAYDDTHRSNFPGLLQSLKDPINLNGIVQVEVLPWLQIAELSQEHKKVYTEFLQALTENTVYEPSISEIALLPDGTVMAFDPGELKYNDDYKALSVLEQEAEEMRSSALVEERLRSWDIPEQFQYFDADGGLKQDRMFSFIGSDNDTTNSPLPVQEPS